ncbi:MAG: serine/threonine-protein kinase [Polyangiales bacterium]
MPIQRVGPYELLYPLGAGGMAETFVAMRRGPAGFEQRVCLKRILPNRANDPRFVELFLDEARLLARMRRANVVQVYDFGECSGTYYMALELVEGADLDALLSTHTPPHAPLPIDAAMYLAAELLAALDYAHTLSLDGQPQHIIHRDVSPSNILVSAHGEVKLTDFGIAKARGRTHKTRTGHTKGKPAYMSPEQVRGDALDQRTDLFSAGVVLYQALTGEHPFDASTDLTLLNNILAGQRRSLRAFSADIPVELVALVDALLEVQPARRPESASEALAYISSSVRSIAGREQLAARVSRYMDVCDASRTETRDLRAQVAQSPTVPHPAHATELQKTSIVAQPAKNTTGRPLHETSERNRRRGLIAAAATALSVAAVGGWAISRDAATRDERDARAEVAVETLTDLPGGGSVATRTPLAGALKTPRATGILVPETTHHGAVVHDAGARTPAKLRAIERRRRVAARHRDGGATPKSVSPRRAAD